jgi:hypothetical protein
MIAPHRETLAESCSWATIIILPFVAAAAFMELHSILRWLLRGAA